MIGERVDQDKPFCSVIFLLATYFVHASEHIIFAFDFRTSMELAERVVVECVSLSIFIAMKYTGMFQKEEIRTNLFVVSDIC